MSHLDFQAFKGAGNKVKLLRFHPLLPWLAYADKSQTVTIWDWSTQQVVFESVLGTSALDEAAAQDAQLQRLAEKDSDFYGGAQQAATPTPRSSSPGSIKDLCFVDADTCFWQLALQQARQHGSHSSASIPHLGKVRGLRGHRWLVLACDAKVLLQDLTSSAVLEVPRAILDAKQPTCVACLYLHSPSTLGENEQAGEGCIVAPVLAIGTTAGTIYMVSVSTLSVVARLAGGHNKAGVTQLAVIGGKDGKSPDRLISGGSDGTVALWDPAAAPLKGPERELAPVTSTKVHDSEVLSMAVVTVPADSPDAGALRLVTSGEDKRVAVLELSNLGRQVARWKPLGKGSVDGLAFSPRAAAGFGAEPSVLLISGERAAVWGLSPDAMQGDAAMLISLDGLLPAGTKKAPKVYAIAAHPLLPHVFAVASNTGIGLLSFDAQAPLPMVALPLQLPGTNDFDSPRPQGSTRGLDYLLATESSLWKVSYRAGWAFENSGRQLTADLQTKTSIAKLGSRGQVVLGVSHNGKHCSVVWPDTSEFAIFTSSGGTAWRQVDSGSGIAVAWASNAPTYAVLHVPQTRALDASRKPGKLRKSKAREEEAAHQAAAAAASAAAQEGAFVTLYQISEGGTSSKQGNGSISTKGDRPIALHGGPLLGITLKREIHKGHRRGKAMRFYSWENAQVVGQELMAPRWLAWDPDVSAVALAYADALVLCRTQPTFAPFASLALLEATSGTWHRRQLQVATPSAIHCIFIAAGPDLKEPFVESVKLASLAGGVVAQMASAGDPTSALPAESMRCAGPVALGGIREGILWLLDVHGQPFMLPLSHAGLRARTLAAHGDAASAVAAAERGLHKANHDELASFIAAMLPDNGLEQALSLSGLTLQAELALCRRAGKFRRALWCLQALAEGADDCAALGAFPSWQLHLSERTPLDPLPVLSKPPPVPIFLVSPTPAKPKDEVIPQNEARRSVLAFIAADNVNEESSEDEEEEEAVEEVVAPAPVPEEPVDWDAALAAASLDELELEPRQEGEDPASAQEDTGDAVDEHALVVPEEEAARVARLVDDGLMLVEAALAFGHQDVAVAGLRILLRGAARLPPEKLQALLVRCAECQMSADIREFAAQLVAHGTGLSPETAALVAALCEDDQLGRAALQAAGLTALSAIYAHTWRSGNALQALQDWGNTLTAAAGNGVQFAVAPPS